MDDMNKVRLEYTKRMASQIEGSGATPEAAMERAERMVAVMAGEIIENGIDSWTNAIGEARMESASPPQDQTL